MRGGRTLRRLLRWYTMIGALLAIIMWGSFTLPVLLSAAPATLGERMIGMLALQPAALFSGLIRFVLWAPSLVLWAFSPEQYSFGLWLAPGFYAALAMGGS